MWSQRGDILAISQNKDEPVLGSWGRGILVEVNSIHKGPERGVCGKGPWRQAGQTFPFSPGLQIPSWFLYDSLALSGFSYVTLCRQPLFSLFLFALGCLPPVLGHRVLLLGHSRP